MLLKRSGILMKKTRILLIVLAAILCITCVFACTNKKTQDKKAREPRYITVIDGEDMKYNLVRPERASTEETEAAAKLRAAFKDKFGVNPDLSDDWIMRGETLEEGLLEILIGKTNRPESEIVKNSLSGDMYAVAVLNDKIVITASSDAYIGDAVDYFIKTYIKPAEEKMEIEASTNMVAVRTSSGWLMARTLGIEILATEASGSDIEIVAAVNAEDYTDIGLEVKVNGEDRDPISGLESKGDSYKLGDVTYKAADYNKTSIVAAKVSGVDSSTLSKIEITPYVVEFGNTLYGLDAFACAYNGSCETISTVEVKDNVYQITNPAEMYVFADYVNRGHRVVDAVLVSNVDMGGIEWTPIASSMMSYKGTFDGNGKTVSNLYIKDSEAETAGFFGCIGSGSVVKNITFSEVYLFADGNDKAGIVAGENRGLIKGCTVAGTISTKDKDGNATTFYTKVGSMDGIGGVVGMLNGKYVTSVEECTFSGSIDITAKNATFVGGIAGCSVAISGDIINCTNTGKISVTSDYSVGQAKNNTGVGGIVGSVVNALVAGSSNKGTVTGAGTTVGYMGGIVGNIIGIGQVADCWNEGSVTANYNSTSFIKSYIGGIVGVFSNDTISDGMAVRCYNKGEVTSNGGYAAGIAGQISDCRSYIMYCYNVGKIKADAYAAGICANAGSDRSFIMSCYNAGDIEAENTAGIIAFAGTKFSESYKTIYSSVDIYINYAGNLYLSDKTDMAYVGNKKSDKGGVAGKEALAAAVLEAEKIAPNLVVAHEYFVADTTNINGGLPIFEYQIDKSKAENSVADDLYTVHSSTIEHDGSRYYYVNRYTDYLWDGIAYEGAQEKLNQKITAAEFERLMDQTVETYHNIIDDEEKVVGQCNCAVFQGDHYFTIQKWKDVLDDVENNLQGVADWANRGEIRHLGYLQADGEQSSGSVAVTVRWTNNSGTLSIKFNVTYYKNERCDGATVHEMAHSQLLDGGNEGWIAEGDADYVKYNYYGPIKAGEDKDRDNYRWKADDYQGAYTPTATFYSFLARMHGKKAVRAIMTFQDVLRGDYQNGWKLAYGVSSMKEAWELFGEAGRWDVDAHFED